MRNIIILAENTSEIAVREKNRPRTTQSHEGNFFAEVGAIGSQGNFDTRSAEPFFTLCSVHPAFPGAESALRKNSLEELSPALQFTLLDKIEI